jgi:sterol 14alpha-demethylase
MAVDLVAVTAGLHGMPAFALAGLAIAFLALAMLVTRVATNTFHGKAPPVDEGIPFVGGLIKFSKVGALPSLQPPSLPAAAHSTSSSSLFQGPWALMNEMYSKHGEVFTVPLLHKKMTFIFGPHASPFFFNATDDKMSQQEVYGFNVPTFGPGVVYDVDNKTRSEQFRMVADALKGAKLRSYIPAFVQETEDYFAKWGQSGEVDLAHVFGELIILTASRTLLGE